MASLSESSVVIALRDWQWNCGISKGVFPEPCVGLSGNAEYKLGDNMLQANERLFLLEIKARRSNINDEWSKKKTKQAFQKSTDLAGDYVSRLTNPMSNSRQRIFHHSLQCHHFVYWEPDQAKIPPGVRKVPGKLYLTPYIFGIRDRCKKLIWRLIRQSWKEEYRLAKSLGRLLNDPEDSIRYEAYTALPLDAVDSKQACIIYDLDTSQPRWDFLGLPLADFQQYVNHLTGGIDGSEEIEVVVMSSDGSYFAYLTSTADLLAIFKPSAAELIMQNDERGTYNTQRVGPALDLASQQLALAPLTKPPSIPPPGINIKKP